MLLCNTAAILELELCRARTGIRLNGKALQSRRPPANVCLPPFLAAAEEQPHRVVSLEHLWGTLVARCVITQFVTNLTMVKHSSSRYGHGPKIKSGLSWGPSPIRGSNTCCAGSATSVCRKNQLFLQTPSRGGRPMPFASPKILSHSHCKEKS